MLLIQIWPLIAPLAPPTQTPSSGWAGLRQPSLLKSHTAETPPARSMGKPGRSPGARCSQGSAARAHGELRSSPTVPGRHWAQWSSPSAPLNPIQANKHQRQEHSVVQIMPFKKKFFFFLTCHSACERCKMSLEVVQMLKTPCKELVQRK